MIVKGVEEEQKTAGGIIIPDTAREKPQQGKAVAAGVNPMALETRYREGGQGCC